MKAWPPAKALSDAVGAENIFIFGLTAEQIAALVAERGYHPMDYYDRDPRLKRVLDALASDRFCPSEPGLFRWIRDVLLNRDDYFLLADFASYIETQAAMAAEFVRPAQWNHKAILNVARIGIFSSDRTVAEYGREIWHLEPS